MEMATVINGTMGRDIQKYWRTTSVRWGKGEKMSEYVKIKRRLYDELIETKGKYVTLCEMLKALEKVYHENEPRGREDD